MDGIRALALAALAFKETCNLRSSLWVQKVTPVGPKPHGDSAPPPASTALAGILKVNATIGVPWRGLVSAEDHETLVWGV